MAGLLNWNQYDSNDNTDTYFKYEKKKAELTKIFKVMLESSPTLYALCQRKPNWIIHVVGFNYNLLGLINLDKRIG